jgi:uncharacterized protein YkwD
MRVLALSLLLLGGIAPTCFAQSATAALSPDEAQFARLINQFRQSLNLPRLDIQPALQSAARKHSDWMDSRDFLTHYGPFTNFTPFQRMSQEGYTNYYYAGENIACGNKDPVKTFRQWAFSPGHLQNMVNPHYHEMGIARSGTGNEHCPYYWTNDFGTYIDPSTDPIGTNDVNLIGQAIAMVSGAIPTGTNVSLNEADEAPATVPVPIPTATPVVQWNPPTTAPVTTPAPTPVPVQDDSDLIWQRLYSQLASGGASVSAQAAPVAALQCLVPYAMGKGILTYYANTDTFVEATSNGNGTYGIKLSYFQNGAESNLYSVMMSNLTITRNADFPVVTLFSAPGTRIGGYSIQVNTRTNQAQFDSYGVSPGVTGSIMCNIRY